MVRTHCTDRQNVYPLSDEERIVLSTFNEMQFMDRHILYTDCVWGLGIEQNEWTLIYIQNHHLLILLQKFGVEVN